MPSSQKIYIVLSYNRDLSHPVAGGHKPYSLLQGAYTTLAAAKTRMRQLVHLHPPASASSSSAEVDAFHGDGANWVSINLDPGDTKVKAMGYKYVSTMEDLLVVWVQEIEVEEEGVQEYVEPFF